MHAIPTKRLLVYIATGLVVLVVGAVGLVVARSGAAAMEDGVVIDAGDAVQNLVGGGLDGTVGGTLDMGSTGDAAGTVDGGATAPAGDTTTSTVPRIWVQVAGAVLCPGVYVMAPGARVFEAVLAAGGFADDADQEAIALAAEVTDGCRVYVPRAGEAETGVLETPTQSSAGITGGSPSGGGSAAGPSTEIVSLNSATLEELDALPGVGPAIAQQIITYRETQGPFTSVDQLTDVPGIGPAKLEQLRPLVGL
jgi:competence protein ComEA